MVSKIPNDIFQFSTASALMQGLAHSGPSAGQLPGYGTHGIGTFSRMNGELLFLNGRPWQMLRSGKVLPADPSTPLPFVQVTNFQPEHEVAVSGLKKADLVNVFEKNGPNAGGKNSFVPFVVKGKFKSLQLRIAGPQEHDGQDLAEVAANARKWGVQDVKGTMFGIASPEWMQGVSVAGVHCHFMTEVEQGKDAEGGHVLDFETADEAVLQWAVTGRYHLGFPRDEEWENLDLKADTAGLSKAEG
ncbi:alpha-acetolactate decarboxylase [Aureobasidium sp. EXF-10727]|nr:alpha-acetolactate decarboxylase [Aureobasidium sp. EXF-10727]